MTLVVAPEGCIVRDGELVRLGRWRIDLKDLLLDPPVLHALTGVRVLSSDRDKV